MNVAVGEVDRSVKINASDMLSMATELLSGLHAGVLATVDENGRPHMRWMSTLSFDDFPVIYTLTSPASRKIQEIASNPEVTWMFTDKDLTMVLNLYGRSKVVNDGNMLKLIWQKLVNMSHLYFLNEYAHKPGFVAIETIIEIVECHSPKHSFHYTAQASEVMELFRPMNQCQS